MKKAIIALAAAAAMGFAGEADAQVKYRLEGTIGDKTTTEAFVLRDVITGKDIDTVRVVKGRIKPLKGTADAPVLCALIGKIRNRGIQPVILENGTTTVKAETDDYFPESLGGTPLNDDAQRLFDELDKMEDDFKEQENPNQEEFVDRLESIVSGVVEKHSGDVLGYFCMNNFVGSLKPAKAMELLKLMAPAWKGNKVFDKRMATFEKMMETSEEAMFTDFAAEYDGKTTRLSDYVGKGQYVLVDFWASWCGPCKAEIPNIINVYNQYKDKGLEVLGVATWDKPGDTLAAIEKLGIPYPQMLNAQQAGSDAYGITGIPEIILFAPDGKIVARGLRGEHIGKKVAEVLK